jgi:hypothetical protein
LEEKMTQEKNPDLETLKMELVDFHEVLIEVHLQMEVDFFVQDISEDYFSVTGGEIRKPTVEEFRARLNIYLNKTTFAEYRDLQAYSPKSRRNTPSPSVAT